MTHFDSVSKLTFCSATSLRVESLAWWWCSEFWPIQAVLVVFVTFLQFFNDFKLIRRPMYEMSELFWNASFFSMSPADLSSLKWEADGEMSAQDTFVLVSRLTRVEQQDNASSLLHLSSKHIHSKRKFKSAWVLVPPNWTYCFVVCSKPRSPSHLSCSLSFWYWRMAFSRSRWGKSCIASVSFKGSRSQSSVASGATAFADRSHWGWIGSHLIMDLLHWSKSWRGWIMVEPQTWKLTRW